MRHVINHYLMRMGRRFQWRRVLAYPEMLQLVPTNACNLRCSNCPKTHYATDTSPMSAEVYERVRRELFPHVRYLSLQGLGEPLLAPLFPRMIEDAARARLEVSFVTNATLLDPPIIRRLVRMGAKVAVSLDGATAATHEHARRGSKFDQIMTAFDCFAREQRDASNPAFELNISTVVNRLNINEIEGIIDIAGRFGARAVSLINPGVGDRTDEFAREAIGKHPQLFAARAPALRAKAAALGVRLMYPAFLDAPEGGLGANDRLIRNPATTAAQPSRTIRRARLFPGRCLDPWTMTYIDVDGWVRPCCRAVWLGMGHILQDPFRTIWNNEHYRRLRASINSDNPPEFCRTCNTNWGINQGDELHYQRLLDRGVTFPPPPKIGIMDDPKQKAGDQP